MNNQPKTFLELNRNKLSVGNPTPTPIYQEGKDSTFTHAGVQYSLDKVLSQVHDVHVKELPISELDWIFRFGKADKERVRKAITSYPILVHYYQGRPTVIDGFHRLTRAQQDGARTIRVKVVSDEVLNKAKI